MMLIGVGSVAVMDWHRKRSAGETSAFVAGLAL